MTHLSPDQALADPLVLEQLELRDHACHAFPRRCTKSLPRCTVGHAIVQAIPSRPEFRHSSLRLALDPRELALLDEARMVARKRLGHLQAGVPPVVKFPVEMRPWSSTKGPWLVGGWLESEEEPLTWMRMAVSAIPGLLEVWRLAQVALVTTFSNPCVVGHLLAQPNGLGQSRISVEVYRTHPARPGDALRAMMACDAILWPSFSP